MKLPRFVQMSVSIYPAIHHLWLEKQHQQLLLPCQSEHKPVTAIRQTDSKCIKRSELIAFILTTQGNPSLPASYSEHKYWDIDCLPQPFLLDQKAWGCILELHLSPQHQRMPQQMAYSLFMHKKENGKCKQISVLVIKGNTNTPCDNGIGMYLILFSNRPKTRTSAFTDGLLQTNASNLSWFQKLNQSFDWLPIGGLFSFENFSRASQSLIVAKAKTLSQYHLFSETWDKQ